MTIHLTPKNIVIKSYFLQNEFSDNVVSAELFLQNYQSVRRVLDNPEKFPKADFDYLQRKEEEMFNEAPLLCLYSR
jgi:hypothetical protein